jgi:ribosomal protein S18 acetylase RimI-like enzyme
MAHSVHTLPQVDPEESTFREYSRRLRDLRLKSLQSDPGSWISAYESEVNQPPEFWWNRLKEPRVIHHVLVKSDPEADPSDIHSALLAGEWLGFVVMIIPTAEDKSPEYSMSALYIDAQARGLGLGKRMVHKVIETVRQHKARAGEESPFCTTNVRHGNDSALTLYQKLGFRVIDADQIVEKEGRKYHTTEMRFDV